MLTLASPSRKPVEVRPLRPDDWPIVEELFGANGACGGCWCMSWRLPRGGKLWEESKGEKNKQAFRKLVRSGHVHGCLAFSGDEPVGWCCVGPRGDFPRIERVKALKSEWDQGTWSVTCFFIRAKWRRRGVASALLKAATELAKQRGAKRLEGYPVKPSGAQPDNMPAPFVWTGVPRLFEKLKFKKSTPLRNPRDIYVKTFRGPPNS